MDTPYWYDTLLLRSIGIITYRKQLYFDTNVEHQLPKDKDIDQGFTVEEQKKIIEKSFHMIVLILPYVFLRYNYRR